VRAEGEMDIQSFLKKLPSVERVLEDDRIASHLTLFARKGITRIVRERIESYRDALINRKIQPDQEIDLKRAVVDDVVQELEHISQNLQRRIINATGVVLHTNLGRAILGDRTCNSISEAASGYIDLEVDLSTGSRVERSRRARRLLTLITGAEDALIVNNNAAAVLLAVQTLAGEGCVAVSRGELVEIGGSFRLPEILSIAARRVIEVGTTNRTHLADYQRAIRDGATFLLKVHTSNFRIVGYTNEVPLKELVELGKAEGVPVMHDQGSGVLYPLHMEGIEGEECIETILESGVDLISFSADKVLGGPQGGIIIGKHDLIETMRHNHLARALRVDKLTLAGLEMVLLHYWNGEYDSLPPLRMILQDNDSLRSRAVRFAERLRSHCRTDLEIDVAEGESSIGGGSFPINPLRTTLVKITLPSGLPEKLSVLLRERDPAILLRVKGESVLIDLRTVLKHEEQVLLEALKDGIGHILGRE
jgi:L-seryl-tRNA(Ser) seleniumtransferase